MVCQIAQHLIDLAKRNLKSYQQRMNTTVAFVVIYMQLNFSKASFSYEEKKISFPLLLSYMKSLSGLLVYFEKSPMIANLIL